MKSRRQNAFADIGSSKLKAAAAASAIALVTTKLAPGQSTDGAVFYPNQGKPLGSGKLIVNMAGETFVFPLEDARATANPRSEHDTRAFPNSSLAYRARRTACVRKPGRRLFRARERRRALAISPASAWPSADFEFASGGGGSGRIDVQTPQHAMNLRAAAHSFDDLLSQVAALAETDGLSCAVSCTR